MKLSKTEQDYIKTIYEFEQQKDEKLVSLKDLSSQLNVSSPTVTEMVKRIEKKGLIVYRSYKGVWLTELGINEALFILKAHRIWEYFLLDVLNYQEEDVHQEAEALEHAVTPRLIERLYEYLGKPERCPHGRIIPQQVFWYENKKKIALSDLKMGIRAEIVNTTQSFLDYLKKLDINEVPKFIKVVDILSDETFIVELNNGHKLVLPAFFQQELIVIVYH